MKKKHYSWISTAKLLWRSKLLKTMRLTLFAILVSVVQLFATNTHAQQTLVSLNVKNTSIRSVLDQIESQSDFYFIYNAKAVDVERMVSIEVENKSIPEILDKIFEGQDVTYKINKRQIAISTNLVVNSVQQEITISGRVTDSSGSLLPGVTVVVKGTTQGTITDTNGNFSIPNVPEDAVLVFSFVGMKTQEILMSGRSIIEVTMAEETVGIEEIVAIGYGTMKKSDLTGSIGSVGSKDLKNQPVENIGQALQGKVSGVLITDNGAPGSDVTIKIRGLGTVNNSDPLIVINGIPTDLSLSSLNLSDIDRIDVLKDASATAIYGSRGANGVVLVSTKKGNNGKAVISVTANWNLQQTTNVPDLLNASQYAAYSNDMLSNAGYATNPDWSDPSLLGDDTDWLDEMLQTGQVQNYTINYSGGDTKKHYYFSAGMLDQQGIVINTSYRRFSFTSNNDVQLKPWLKVANNLIFSTDDKDSGGYSIANAMYASPTQSVYDDNGTWSGPVGSSLWYGDIINPVGLATINKNNTKGYNLLANLMVEITLAKGLTFKSTYGYDAKFWYYNNFTPAYDWEPTPVEESSRYQGSYKSFTYLYDNYFTYDHLFGDHHLNVMAGVSAQNNKYNYLNATVSGFLYDNVSEMSNATEMENIDGTTEEWAIFSTMARANYNYKDKYLFTATIRRDGSSRFGSGNKYGWFPSFSGAYRITQENWFPTTSWLDNGKIRVGYGVTGNQEIGNYTFSSTYETGVYVFNGTQVESLASVTMANPDVHWEEVRQTNVGIDLAMLNNRVMFSVDGYVKNTCDMLVKAALPITSGYGDVTTTYVNAGKVRNKGVEFSLNTVNFNGDFRWETAFNASYNKNKIVDLNGNTPMYINQYNNSYLTIQTVGAPVNSFLGYQTDGIFQNEEEIDEHAYQSEAEAGDIRYKDLNNDGVIDEKDRTIIGNPNPTWIFSMNNTFHYKAFDLSIYLQGVTGNDIYNVNNITSEGMSSAYNQTTTVLGRWTGEGTSNSMPRAVYGDPNQNCRVSNRFIENGSYLRVKNVTFAYNLPQNILSKIKLTQAQVNLSCENLFTFTPYSGFDPEVDINGIDSDRYPLSRTFSVGVNFKF